MKVSGPKENYKPKHIIASVFLIAVGIAAGYFIISGLFFEVKLISFIGLIYYVPTLIVICILPIYCGIALIVDAIKDIYRKDDA